MSSNKIDLTTDAGFEILKNLDVRVPLNTEIDRLIQKQAYADDETFADTQDRRFSIASKDETEISLRYAEKCASALSADIVERLEEAASIYGLREFSPEAEVVKEANDMFALAPSETVELEKYAGVTEYGTELENSLMARAYLVPEEAEEFEKMAALRSELSPEQMVELIKTADEELGLDFPGIRAHVGSPEYAVFEKRGNDITVDLGTKKVGFERLSEMGDVLTDLGVSIDFDENDPYTTKMAIERLPKLVKSEIAKYV